MMSRLLWLPILASLAPNPANAFVGFDEHHAFGHETHGGDTVYCEASDDNDFEGYYILDYMMTYRKSNNNADLVVPADWNASASRIQSLLDANTPHLARSFAQFTSLIGSTDHLQPRVWEEIAFGYEDVGLEDQDYVAIDRSLPANCLDANHETGIRIIRTIKRTAGSRVKTYGYVYDIIQALGDRPLQLSFLYVHEWLRDFTRDPYMLWRVNRLLHSSEIDAEGYDLARALENIEFETSGRVGFVPVQDRTPEVRNVLESQLSLPAEEIQGTELSRNYYFKFSHSSITSIKPGDFSGLGQIRKLDLSQNDIEVIDSWTFHNMAGNGSSPTIDASHNKIRTIHHHAFANLLFHDGKLSLQHNEIDTIDSQAFAGLTADRLILANNNLGQLPDELCIDSDVHIIVLSHNNLSTVDNVDWEACGGRSRIQVDHNQIETLSRRLFSRVLVEFIVRSDLGVRRINARHSVFTQHLIDLSHNRISTIEDDAFADLQDVERPEYGEIVVDLSSNQLRRLETPVVQDLWESGARLILTDNPLDDQIREYLRTQFGNRVQL